MLTKRQIIYVYHNQIDARGDKANTEDEVFHACEEAVQEIVDLIHRISVSGNTYHLSSLPIMALFTSVIS